MISLRRSSGKGAAWIRVPTPSERSLIPLRSCRLSADIRDLIGPCFSKTSRNLSKAAVHTTKPGGTEIPARVNSPNDPPFPPTKGRSFSVMSANQRMFPDEPIADGSQVKLRIDRYPVLAAVTFIMVDKPEDVGGLYEIAAIVVELDRPLKPGEQLHARWVVADECGDQTGCF